MNNRQPPEPRRPLPPSRSPQQVDSSPIVLAVGVILVVVVVAILVASYL